LQYLLFKDRIDLKFYGKEKDYYNPKRKNYF